MALSIDRRSQCAVEVARLIVVDDERGAAGIARKLRFLRERGSAADRHRCLAGATLQRIIDRAAGSDVDRLCSQPPGAGQRDAGCAQSKSRDVDRDRTLVTESLPCSAYADPAFRFPSQYGDLLRELGEWSEWNAVALQVDGNRASDLSRGEAIGE